MTVTQLAQAASEFVTGYTRTITQVPVIRASEDTSDQAIQAILNRY